MLFLMAWLMASQARWMGWKDAVTLPDKLLHVAPTSLLSTREACSTLVQDHYSVVCLVRGGDTTTKTEAHTTKGCKRGTAGVRSQLSAEVPHPILEDSPRFPAMEITWSSPCRTGSPSDEW